jgi:hypothetical protein
MAISPLSSQALADIEGALIAIAHKFSTHREAEIARDGTTLALRYAKPVPHPWPRQVEFSAEVMGVGLDAIVRTRPSLLKTPQETHLASVFGCIVADEGEAISAAGYDGCWTSALMVFDLARAPPPIRPGISLERVSNAAQIEAFNAIDPQWLTALSTLTDPHVIELHARDPSGALAGAGKIYVGFGDIAYVADMWTAPASRQNGIGHAVLAGLHRAAQEAGAKRATLLPSLMAVQTGFYVKFGYEVSARMGVLLSKAA